MLEITYGYKAKDAHDPFILSAETLVHNYAQASALSKFIVNWLPSRMISTYFSITVIPMHASFSVAYVPNWIPGAGFQQTAVQWKSQMDGFTEDAYQYVVKSMVCPCTFLT